jgi:hypothetical protein
MVCSLWWVYGTAFSVPSPSVPNEDPRFRHVRPEFLRHKVGPFGPVARARPRRRDIKHRAVSLQQQEVSLPSRCILTTSLDWLHHCRPVHVRHLVTVDVVGRPATFATASERAWKDAVRKRSIVPAASRLKADSLYGSSFDCLRHGPVARCGIWTTSSSQPWTPWKASSVYDNGEGYLSQPTAALIA